MTELEMLGMRAKAAEKVLALAGTAQKNMALSCMADALEREAAYWLSANEMDMEAAVAHGMPKPMQDRLRLTETRVKDIADAMRQVVSLQDPTAVFDHGVVRPNGLRILKKRVPLGVIGIIYEARPNVTADAAALCLKSGNACILRGGREAIHSNMAAVKIMRDALGQAGLPQDCICLVEDTSRESAQALMQMDEYIDVLIPRGGAGLIRSVAKNATVPVIRTGEGVCHVYVDASADITMAADVLVNAKCSRPSVCNAAECVLVHSDVAEQFFVKVVPMLKAKGVELRCDARSLAMIGDSGIPAVEEDWDAEYDDLILAVRVVDNAEEAVAFINEHGTQHSESILTQDYAVAQYFLEAVDAAAVYVNASTRFTDGGEFGLGAEIGISTQKLHARGPMGLAELTTIKYMVYGNGQIR